MVPGDVLIDGFINANILIAVAYCLWAGLRYALSLTDLKHAHGTHLKVLNCVFLAIALSPFFLFALSSLQAAGIGRALNVNLSDMVVSIYLGGGFEMPAREFEQLLFARDSFTTDVLAGRGWMAQLVIALFFAGLALGVLRLSQALFSLHRIVSDSYAWRRFGKLHLRLSDHCMVPFSTRGLLGYYVVVPAHMLGQPDELKTSLAHEFQHLRQGDITWEILLETLKPFFYLNPAYHAWKRQVEHLRELRCDSAVLSRGRIGLRTYCDTLLSVCQQNLRQDRLFQLALPKVALVSDDRAETRRGKISFLEQRITLLMEARPSRYPKLTFAGLMLPVLAITMLTAIAIQRPGDWSHDRLMLSTVVNLDRLDEINRLSTFGRLRD